VGELAHDRLGSGEPLVLLHGLGSRRAAWKPVVELVERQREVLNVDLPGFGESQADEAGTELTVGDYADRIERFIGEQGVEWPHVAGNSLGGGIALELGRRGAARTVTAISPIGFWHEPGRAWCRWSLRAGWELGRRLPESARTLTGTRLSMFVFSFGRPFAVPAEEVWATAASGQAAPGFLGALRSGLAYDFDDAGALREIPVTVAWGRRDVLLPCWAQARRARQALPWARHVTLPRCGHVPFYDDPRLLADVVLGATAGRR
jgi:pimeloyl-ACP methyl ester carboxylesterase